MAKVDDVEEQTRERAKVQMIQSHKISKAVNRNTLEIALDSVY